MLIVNGHGSNTPQNDIIARRTVLETNALCVAVNYINLALEDFATVQDTPVVAHADEFETSLYLYLDESRVQMDKAGAGDDVMGTYFSSDSTGVARFNDFWGRWTDLGVHGDARTATAAKGEVIFESAVGHLITLVDELRAWPIAERKDMHAQPADTSIRW